MEEMAAAAEKVENGSNKELCNKTNIIAREQKRQQVGIKDK